VDTGIIALIYTSGVHYYMNQNKPVKITIASSAERSLATVRDLVNAGFELRREDGDIVVEGHATMTISEDGESILTRIEAFD